jgi:plastocyanin
MRKTQSIKEDSMRTLRYALIGGALTLLGAGVLPAQASPTATAKATIKAVEGGQSYVFAPVKKTVKVGTKVTWTNPSDAPHTVTSNSSSKWKFNKQLTVGAKVSFTFKKAGTYKYHCQFHTGMVGKIVVTM